MFIFKVPFSSSQSLSRNQNSWFYTVPPAVERIKQGNHCPKTLSCVRWRVSLLKTYTVFIMGRFSSKRACCTTWQDMVQRLINLPKGKQFKRCPRLKFRPPESMLLKMPKVEIQTAPIHVAYLSSLMMMKNKCGIFILLSTSFPWSNHIINAYKW